MVRGMNHGQRDRYLGMDRAITRRDFINGAAAIVGGTLLAGSASSGSYADTEPRSQTDYGPPQLTGLRGSHPGSFETAHALRDGTFWKTASTPIDTGEVYDLVVVGGGISGLSAAHFFREHAGKSARVLILENHDDFGGHAKRNEFHLGGKLQLLNGGTMLIDSPTAYSVEAAGLMNKLGIDAVALDKKCTDHGFYKSHGLETGVFFDREMFGTDRLVAGFAAGEGEGGADAANLQQFLEKTPLSESVRRDILRIERAKIDHLPGLNSAAKK